MDVMVTPQRYTAYSVAHIVMRQHKMRGMRGTMGPHDPRMPTMQRATWNHSACLHHVFPLPPVVHACCNIDGDIPEDWV